MSAEIKKEIQLEIAHVLFTDIVGYSKLLINEQSWHYSRCTDSDFFAIRKITHMSAEILSRIVENFIGAKRATKGFALKSATPIRETDLDESSAR
jgi:hypothetical protein